MHAVVLLAILALSGCGGGTEYRVESLYGVSDPQFQRTMGALLGPAFVPGNRITTLLNGDEIFPAMLDAIAGAKRSISIETFVYWSGGVGAAFTDALSAITAGVL